MDAVITWVDGEDPAHLAKRAAYREGGIHPDTFGSTRFANSGELRFCVRSLLRFCPFIDRIHIVTDDQYPAPVADLLDDPAHANRLRLVDHTEIFAEFADLLPVFSSRSIETMIHRIPDLSERFIYLNDDIFIGRTMSETDFFDEGRPVLRGRFRPFPSRFREWLKIRLRGERPGYAAAQRDAARLVGRTDRYFLLEHQPQPMRRQTLRNFFQNDPQALRRQVAHRFRSAEQVSPLGLACHLELAAGARTISPVDVGYVKPGRPTGDALRKTLSRLQEGGFESFCVQSLDAMSAEDRIIVLDGLARHYD
ncbi:stealth family protein [Jannaschia seosinensis]|nr:stealth family protein [Jannaschia seosinensis]